MPEGSRRSSQRSHNSSGSRPSSLTGVSSVRGCRGMSSSDRVQSVDSELNSQLDRSGSLSSVSSVSLQDATHSSSSSSLQNGSDISLDLTPIGTGNGPGVVMVTGQLSANQPAAGAGPKPLSRLERVALEIVETEQAYVRDLKSIVEDYLGCIIDCGEVPLKPEQVSALFCNIEDIYEFNSDLLEDLERSPDAAAIADCFVERSEAFDIYTLYCMNYPNSVAVLRDCMQDEVLVKFFHQRQSSLNHSLPLETYLLKPVQRILKYHLLLQELSKHLSKADPGYEVVEDAIVAMTAVAWYINDMKRKQEHAIRLQEIEAQLVNWSGPDLSGFGELVLEGSFRVHRVKKERAFFLFDRMLLIAKKRLEHFVYSTHIFCCNLLLVETLKDPLSFKISDQTIPKQQHIVQTRNQEEKRLWVHYLKRLIVENHPASLPQKARQVLGDNFCQTPQFQQEALKSYSNPRLDDIHNFHRGRRPSEPQELLFTPEKSRKSLPLLLDGNLPYRRSRRQSAPAKDIEAAFHSTSLKSAESEGQLCFVNSLDSGSCSTLASSVIEVEPELSQDLANPDPTRDQKDQDQQEPDEEELVTPPTSLSITEEILQLLNQSRRDDAGLKEQEPPPEQNKHGRSNFTCPLPPVISPCSPEPLPTMQQEAPPATQQDAPPTPVQESVPTMQQEQSEETSQEQDGDRENRDADILVEKEPETEMSHETVPDGADDKNNQEITNREAESEPEIPKTSNDEVVESVESCVNEDSTVQRRLCPTRGSQRRKRDKNIIEKIRSYYEAAAEAEEDGETTGEEDELSEGDEDDEERPRSSVSKIPSGFVRDSVTRFSSNEEKTADIGKSGGADIDKRNAQDVCPEIGEVFEEMQEDEDQVTSARNVDAKHASDEVKVCQNELKDSQTKGDDTEKLKNVKTVCGPKVGRWSRHSRIVSANRALFEGMASDVARIGLFEAGPVADLVLLENSERILNKVQTLARMYSEKASHVKAQHQRRAVFSQSWSAAVRGGGQLQGGGVKAANQAAQTKDRQRTDPPVSDSTDPVTRTEPLSSNGVSPPRSRDALRGSRPEEGLGPGLTQDRSSVWGHTSSDCGLRSTTEPGQSFLPRREDLPFTSVTSSAKNKNCLPEIQSALFPAAKKHCYYSEASAKVAKINLLEETGFGQTHPGTSRELSQSKTLSLGCGGPDAPLWESGGLVQKHELLQLSQHENTSYDGAGASCFHNNKEEKARMGLLVQSPQEQVDTIAKRIEKMPIDALVKEESPIAKHQTSELTGRQAHNDAPFLGYQSPDTPLRSSGEELPQKCAPNLGHTSRDEINDQPSTFKNLGNQSREVPLSESGGPGVSTSLLPSSTCAAPVDEGRGLSAQSPVWPKEQLPTFTNQRPAHLQGVKSYVPNAAAHESIITTTNTTAAHKPNNTMLHEQRLQSTVGPNPRPWSRPGLDSPALAALLPGPALSSISAFKPDLHQRSPSPVPKPPDLHHRSSSPVPKPPNLHQRCPSPVPKPPDLHHCSSSPVPKPPDLHHRSSSPVPKPPDLHQHSPSPVSKPPDLHQRSPSPVPKPPDLHHCSPSPAPKPPDLHQHSPSPVPKPPDIHHRSPSPVPKPSDLHHRSPSPIPKPPDLHHRSPSPVPKPHCPSPVPNSPDLHRRCLSPIANLANPYLVPNLAEKHPHQDPQRPSNLGLRSARPSPASAFTRSLAASCISQSISQSMSKRTSTPAPLPSTYHLRQRSPSPKSSVEMNQHPKSFLWSPQSLANRPQRQTAGPGHANANNSNNVNIGFSSPHATNWASDEATLDSTWTNSHNRVARPFCASEPNSRVQSPTSFSHDLSSPLANKPPNPRRPGSAHNPLGLTLDINRASAMSYSSSLCPQIMSPPPIGVSMNAWSNHIAMPQPRNAHFTPSPTSVYPTSLRNSRNASPSPPFSPTPQSPLRRSHSTTLADRAPSPARSNPGAARRSWVETSRRSTTFNGPFDQHEAGFYRSSYTSPALACLSPRAALQSPVSPSQFSPARNPFSGQQFAGVPWSDEITRSFTNDFNTSLHPQETHSWADPELDEGTCRSQIICAYVSRPPRPPSHPNLLQNQSYSPVPPSPAKPANQRTSYATTVNLQIAGSGRIKAFSTAQVSLTQTLQNGAQTQGALTRRVSVHGLPQ